MENRNQNRINISAPNLLSICVDHLKHNEIGGRIYHYYSEEPIPFANVVELLRNAEQFFDRIAFPQASTKTRCFTDSQETEQEYIKRPDKKISWEELLGREGILGTFVISVMFRQSSTWQGEFLWKEKGIIKRFSNTLEFIKQMDEALRNLHKKVENESKCNDFCNT